MAANNTDSDLWVKEMEETDGAFEGDIILDPDEYEHGWNVNKEEPAAQTYASIKGGRWPGAEVPYVIDRSISSNRRARDAIAKAIKDYHSYTCIRFKQRTDERTYVLFKNGAGCSSPIGYRAGRVNMIRLAQGCRRKGTVMHEIGHTLGLYHEQSRPDRDKHVRILWGNIKSNMRHNFNKQQNINSLGTPYDIKSMMHYGQKAFSIDNRRLTIKTKNPANQRRIGQRHGFSNIDKKQINLMYCKGGSNKWYCVVTINNGVQLKTRDLGTAQRSLGTGNAGNRQAIIPMTGRKAGDPTTLSKSWTGGSMWWYGWDDIRAMQSQCSAAGLPDAF